MGPLTTLWPNIEPWKFCCSAAKLCLTLWPYGLQHARLPCPSLSPGVCSNSRPLDVGDAIQPSHPLQSTSAESALHIRWPKYWSFSFSISPSNEHSGLISFRIDWFVLLAVQGTLKSPFQHHNSKSISSSSLSLLYGPTLTSIHD